MTPKLFREHLKMGHVLGIRIVERCNISNNNTVVSFKLRNHPFMYQLDREFLTIISAAKYVINALDKPIIDGLTQEYQAIPPVLILKKKRLANEKSKHVQETESPELPQRQPCQSS